MQPEAQWLMVESLARARAERESLLDDAARQRVLNHHRGVLQGFRYLGAITPEEESAWSAKMVDALGLTHPKTVGVQLQHGATVPPITATARSRPPAPIRGWATPARASSGPCFLRYVAGPAGEYQLHGGLLRVIAVEIYDTLVVVRWAATQEPDLSMVFPEEAAALEADMMDLEGWAADELRKRTKQQLRMQRLYTFRLSDDVSTEYFSSGHSWGGGAEGTTGEASFLPTVPLHANTLTLEWFGLAIDISLLPIGGKE